MTLGLTNGAGNNGGLVAATNSAVYGRIDGFGKSLPCTNTATATLSANQMLGVTTDASKSGMACSVTIPSKSTSSSSLSTLKLGKYLIKYK